MAETAQDQAALLSAYVTQNFQAVSILAATDDGKEIEIIQSETALLNSGESHTHIGIPNFEGTGNGNQIEISKSGTVLLDSGESYTDIGGQNFERVSDTNIGSDGDSKEIEMSGQTSLDLEESYVHIDIEPTQSPTVESVLVEQNEVIKVGSQFSSFESILNAIKIYEDMYGAHLCIAHSRTIESSIKTGRTGRASRLPLELKYGEIKYGCVHSGKHKSTSSGLRAASSVRTGCQMHIRFGVNSCGSHLVVKSMSEEHNHPLEAAAPVNLHPELARCVREIVWATPDISMEELKGKLQQFVENALFSGQPLPESTNKEYFPTSKMLRYYVVKAKNALMIDEKGEKHLLEQAEQYQEQHTNDKLLYNFDAAKEKITTKIKKEKPTKPKKKKYVPPKNNDDFFSEDFFEPDSLHGSPFKDATSPHNNSGPSEAEATLQSASGGSVMLFCHQTPHQQRLLKRYGGQLMLIEVCGVRKFTPFPVYALLVQTNVDLQLTATFILRRREQEALAEGLTSVKMWNPGLAPKVVMCDFAQEEITAVEAVFPDSFIAISEGSRIENWQDWVNDPLNEVLDVKDELIEHLQAIANSHSEDALNAAARTLEESYFWKSSEKLRKWFQSNWLVNAKRWVCGYRPEDYLQMMHMGCSIEDVNEAFKLVKVSNSSFPIKDVIEQLVEAVIPAFEKRYISLNEESFRLRTKLFKLSPDIPGYLRHLPGKIILHVYERMQLAAGQDFQCSELHPGIYSVHLPSQNDTVSMVSFGDQVTMPSCNCDDFQHFRLPCIHFCVIFASKPDWTWDMLSDAYKVNPLLNVDWLCQPIEEPDTIESSTQTDDSALESHIKFPKGVSQNIHATRKVLASQCTSLLQQISKMPLSQHSQKNLLQLKTVLHDTIAVLSVSKKKANPPSQTVTGACIQEKEEKQLTFDNTSLQIANADTPTPSSDVSQYVLLPMNVFQTPEGEEKMFVVINPPNEAGITNDNRQVKSEPVVIETDEIKIILDEPGPASALKRKPNRKSMNPSKIRRYMDESSIDINNDNACDNGNKWTSNNMGVESSNNGTVFIAGEILNYTSPSQEKS